MGNFAFIVCPATIRQLKQLRPLYRLLPDVIALPALRNSPPFKVAGLRKVRSAGEKETQGNIIVCPLLDDASGKNSAFDKLLSAAGIVKENNPGILGLDSCALFTEEERFALAKRLKIPLTNGAAFTAWSVFEAVHRIAKAKNMDLKKSTLAVIGATGCIGSVLTKKLADYAAKLILVSGDRDKLRQLKDSVAALSPTEIIIDSGARRAVEPADIVIHIAGEFNAQDLKPNAIVCSLYSFCEQPAPPQGRKDITFIRAGLIKLPYPADSGIVPGLPKNIIFASLAEVMLLALEGKLTSYSLSDNINPDKLEEIANIAVRAGFEVWVPEAPVL